MKRLVAALSLANLFMMRIWVELLGERMEPAPTAWYGAALITLLVLTGLVWIVAKWGGFPGRLLLAIGGSVLLLKAAALAFGQQALNLKAALAALVDAGLRQGWLWPAALALLLLLGWAAWRVQLRWAPAALIMLSPIVFVTVGQAALRLTQNRPVEAAFQPRTPGSPRPGPRVVWIVFDELDERIAFSQRPPNLPLPAFDAFAKQAISFSQAFSHSNSTADVIPAALGDLFARSHLAGHRAGLVGWFLPYCKTYGADLDACETWHMDRQLNSYGSDVLTAARNQLRSLSESSLYSLFGQSLAIEAHSRTIVAMEAAAERMVARPDLDLVFIHLPVPHPPFVYDAAKQDLTASNQDSRGYLPNLQLADQIFGRLRARLTQAGLWEATNVLLTGDHGFRQADRLGYPPGDDQHVPLLWKPAGPTQRRCINQRVETRTTGKLVLRILHGEGAESVLAGYP